MTDIVILVNSIDDGAFGDITSVCAFLHMTFCVYLYIQCEITRKILLRVTSMHNVGRVASYSWLGSEGKY